MVFTLYCILIALNTAVTSTAILHRESRFLMRTVKGSQWSVQLEFQILKKLTDTILPAR